MSGDHEFQAIDPAAAGARAENAAIVAHLALSASPQPDSVGSPWAVGGHGVPLHPDLVERVIAVGAAAELDVRFLYGVPIMLTRDGIVVAAGLGMREIRVRLAPNQIAPVLLTSQSEDPDLGEGWARVAAWAVDVPAAEIVPALAAVCRAAAQSASPTRPRPRRANPGAPRRRRA
jgi:hypothetical protein